MMKLPCRLCDYYIIPNKALLHLVFWFTAAAKLIRDDYDKCQWDTKPAQSINSSLFSRITNILAVNLAVSVSGEDG